MNGPMSERQVRRIARKHGFTVRKSRARNQRDVTFGGYMLARDGVAVAGGEGRGFSLGLDGVAAYLLGFEDGIS